MVGPTTIVRREKHATNRARAKLMRHDPVATEKLFWKKLRDRRLGGYKFKRQVLIGPYIADFACLERKIIVELDGPLHASRVAYDRKRDAYLAKCGFRILRFSNATISEWDLGRILDMLRSPSPWPSPPEGERENPP
ncbi:MAG TPA: DUF559 domain-containing protein [Verrucomicrobiaceae bacterium]|jgi:very-short-patch-repair endonuclease